MQRKSFLAMALAILAVAAHGQQQITRVGVIDLQKVYTTYFKDSEAVRAFEEEKRAVQDEILRLSDEIKALQAQRVALQASGDVAGLKALDEVLYRKAQYLSDYIRVKQAELDEKARWLTDNDAFAPILYRAIQTVSEADGYSLVLSMRNATDAVSSVVWFSPMVDITDKVIQILRGMTPAP